VLRLRPRVVRVNGADTRWFADDLAAAAELQLEALVLPKATPEAVAALGPEGPPVIAIAETAQGLRLAYETASSPRVAALLIGAADLGAALGWEPRADGLEVLYTRSKVVADSAAAGIRAPFDIVHLDTRDDAGLEAETRFARSLGFRGKACIHPGQVPIVNRVFEPEADGLAWARRVVDAFEQGRARRTRRGRARRRDDRPTRRCARAADHRGSKGRDAWPLRSQRRRRSGRAASTRTSTLETSSAAASAAR
jgi:citrate lyase beta subunit